MYFRLRYVLDRMLLDLNEGEALKFSFGGEHRVVVNIFRVPDENFPAGKKLLCEGIGEQSVEKSIQDGLERLHAKTPPDAALRASFDQLLSELYDYMRKTVTILRWRHSLMDGPMNVFMHRTESFSFDGTSWRETTPALSLRISFGHPFPQAKISEKLCGEIVSLAQQGRSEPLTRELFREAWSLSENYPKAALVIGVAAAEIGFRAVVGRIGGRKGILTLLAKYWPHASPIPEIQGKEIRPSPATLETLKNSIHRRDSVVHESAPAPGRDELYEFLWNISQLLWIWDFYAGDSWALEHVGANSLSQ